MAKTQTVRARVESRLKERFLIGLREAGLSESDFIISSIRRFCDEMEEKMVANNQVKVKRLLRLLDEEGAVAFELVSVVEVKDRDLEFHRETWEMRKDGRDRYTMASENETHVELDREELFQKLLRLCRMGRIEGMKGEG